MTFALSRPGPTFGLDAVAGQPRTERRDKHRAASDSGNAAALVFFLFDLLYLDGEDVSVRPLIERKTRLAALLSKAIAQVRSEPCRWRCPRGRHGVLTGPDPDARTWCALLIPPLQVRPIRNRSASDRAGCARRAFLIKPP